MKFEWDSKKEKLNNQKHGISFKEVTRLFQGRSDYLELYDNLHSDDEDRFIAIGKIIKGVVVVVYVERDFDVIRIISARKANKAEIKLFDEFKRGES